jgi:hypothetical protein
MDGSYFVRQAVIERIEHKDAKEKFSNSLKKNSHNKVFNSIGYKRRIRCACLATKRAFEIQHISENNSLKILIIQ